jgi:hypothetical protein
MEYVKLEYYLSKPRLDRFLQATGNSRSRAKKLYRVNLRVSQSFYPVLNLFEIFLRNSLNHHLSGYFSNDDWIITEKAGFMQDPTLKGSKFHLRACVMNAEKVLRRKGSSISSGKVIAEQSFGFWTSLFERHHYRLIGGTPIQCFPNKPATVNRSTISQMLNRIRRFRNRVYHNEPICFNNSQISFAQAQRIKADTFNLLNWIDPALVKYVDYFNSIDTRINSAANI